ncbi:MAG: nuclear transport factor 2 family protein [Acidimicrobiales bacterium]
MDTNTSNTIIPTTTPTPVDDDPKVAAVQRLYAAVARNDLDAILDEVADDVDWAANAASSSVPWYGPLRGRAGVADFFAAIGSNVEITDFTPLGYAANETDVMVPVRWSYVVRSTGERAEMTMQHWWRFAEGKIVFFRGAEDSQQSSRAFHRSSVEGGTSPVDTADGPRGGGAVPGAVLPSDPKVGIVMEMYDAFARQDLPTILSHLTEDVDWAAEAADAAAPWHQAYRGIAEVPGFFGALGGNVEIGEFVPVSVTVNETDVMVVVRWSVTAAPTGRPLVQLLHHWWRFDGERISWYRGLDDSEQTAAAFA